MNLIIISSIWGIVLMFSGLFFPRKSVSVNIAIIGAILLLVANTLDINEISITTSTFNGLLQYDFYGYIFLELLLISFLFYLLLSAKQVTEVGNHPYEYFALMFFVMAGIGLVTFFNNLLILFIGIEIVSIPLFILTGSDKRNLKSNEASLKYFLTGAFSTGILLLGIAFLYGASGSFQLDRLLTEARPGLGVFTPLGLVFVLVALGFKVSAAPFHFWTPDAYDGAPTVFTSFMAAIVKLAAFVAFSNLFLFGFADLSAKWQLPLALMTVATLLIGNITAVYQQSVKRMLAYSSIAQAGFMLLAVFSGNDLARQGLLLYTPAYCIATIGIFAVLIRMEDYTYDGFNGLASRHPMVAFCVTVFLLSLAGIPLTAGFFAKYFMLASVVKTGGFLWLVIAAVVLATISVYYYFRVIQAMYFKPASSEESFIKAETLSFRWLLLAGAILLIALGVFPYQLLLNWLVA
ncbi:MAG: NADH-quinone oxidoreductase subunit N [Bacteroidota bacterium]